MAYQKWHQRNIDQGLCRDCKKPILHGTSTHCPSCAKKSSNRSAQYVKERREKWKLAGLCYQCGKEKETEKLRCDKCHEKLMAYNYKTRKKREASRLEGSVCYQCGGKIVHGEHKLCEICLLKQYAYGATKKSGNWEYLRDLLAHQNYKCAYTGEAITFGLNASIDHIIPKSHRDYPGDKDLSNLCWTTKKTNIVKNNLSKDELIEFCKKVITNI